MSDQGSSTEPPTSATPSHPPDGNELSIDVRGFLPEGTELVGTTATPGHASSSADREEPDDGGTTEALESSAGSPEVEVQGDRSPVDLAALTRIEAELAAVDSALTALDNGSYGTCNTCGTELDVAALESDPVLVACPTHAGA